MDLNIFQLIFISISIYAFLFLYLVNNNISKKIFITATTAHLFLIQGFRSITVGTDLQNYYIHFTEVETSSWFNLSENSFEIGYNLFVKILATLNLDFQTLILIISVFNLSVLGLMVYKYSLNPYLTYVFYLLLGLYDFGFSGLRQSIAMSIVLIAFNYFYQKEYFKTIIITLVASTFHITSLIFLAVFLFTNDKFSKVYKRMYLLLFTIIIFFRPQIVNIINNIFGQSYENHFGVEQNELFGTTFILLFIITLISFYFNRKTKVYQNSERIRVIMNILTLTLIIQSFSVYSYLFTRLNLYFFHIIILFIPHLEVGFNNIVSKKNQLLRFTVRFFIYISITFIGFMIFSGYLSNEPHDILPYTFFWNKY